MKAAAVSGGTSPKAQLALVGYWIAGGLFLDQLLQIWSVVDGIDLAVPSWRFQLALVLSGKVLVVLLAVVVAIATARLRRPSPPAPILGLLLGVAVIGSMVMAIVLVVDGSGVAYTIPGAQFRGFTESRLRGIGLLLAGAAIFWRLFRGVRSSPEPAPGVAQALNRSPPSPLKSTQPPP